MKTWKINSAQLAAFIAFLIVTPTTGISILNIIKLGGVDAYISVILMTIFGLIPLYMVIYISNYNHKLNIIDVNIDIFGKTFGKLINYLLFIIYFIIALCTSFSIDYLIVSQFLNETPITFMSLMFGLVTIYNLSKGFQNMSRVSYILFFINVGLVILGFIGLIPTFEFSNLKPILEHGMKNPIIGALSITSTNILPILVMLVIPKDNIIDKENFSKKLIRNYFIANLVILSIVVMCIGNLGIYLSKLFQYPEYFVLKKISFLDFIDRIENIVTIKWVFSKFSTYSIILYFLCKVLNNSKDDKVKIGYSIIIILSITLITFYTFIDNTSFNNFGFSIYPYITGSLLIFYIIIFIGVFIKKRLTKR